VDVVFVVGLRFVHLLGAAGMTPPNITLPYSPGDTCSRYLIVR